MAGAVDLTSVDHKQIKEQMIQFVESTGLFPGCDFEGSNWSVLFDVLAYQQQLNAYSTNLVANEAFLDSAVIRKNVVSHATNLGYSPTSAKCAKSVIDFYFQLQPLEYPAGFPAFLTLQPGMAFVVANGRSSGIFNVIDDVTISVTNDGLGEFYDVEVYEGTYLNAEFVVDIADYDQRFILENKYIDTDTIRVYVQENPAEEVREFYTPADNFS